MQRYDIVGSCPNIVDADAPEIKARKPRTTVVSSLCGTGICFPDLNGPCIESCAFSKLHSSADTSVCWVNPELPMDHLILAGLFPEINAHKPSTVE